MVNVLQFSKRATNPKKFKRTNEWLDMGCAVNDKLSRLSNTVDFDTSIPAEQKVYIFGLFWFGNGEERNKAGKWRVKGKRFFFKLARCHFSRLFDQTSQNTNRNAYSWCFVIALLLVLSPCDANDSSSRKFLFKVKAVTLIDRFFLLFVSSTLSTLT